MLCMMPVIGLVIAFPELATWLPDQAKGPRWTLSPPQSDWFSNQLGRQGFAQQIRAGRLPGKGSTEQENRIHPERPHRVVITITRTQENVFNSRSGGFAVESIPNYPKSLDSAEIN